jgi:hypothetical protein
MSTELEILSALCGRLKEVTGESRPPLAYARLLHPDDWFLFLVLFQVEDGYVVWTYNAQLDSLENGHYFTSPDKSDRTQQLASAYGAFSEILNRQWRELKQPQPAGCVPLGHRFTPVVSRRLLPGHGSMRTWELTLECGHHEQRQGTVNSTGWKNALCHTCAGRMKG